MPTFNRKVSGSDANKWYIRKNTANLDAAPPVSTFQVAPKGRKMLLELELDHENTPEQKAEIDDDLFYLLNDLGLLSKKDTGVTPSDAISESASYSQLERLSDTQRASFAQVLLEQYSLDELCRHESVFEFLTALTDLPDEALRNVLSRILDGTPFDARTLVEYDEAFQKYAELSLDTTNTPSYNSVSLAIICYFLYSRWRAAMPEIYNDLLSSNEGEPIWVWDDWVGFSGTELIFYMEIGEQLESAPPLVRDALAKQTRWPEMGALTDFLNLEFSALAAAQIGHVISQASPSLGVFVRHGLQSNAQRRCATILPRPDNHDTNTPVDAFNEANTEALSTMEDLFQTE